MGSDRMTGPYWSDLAGGTVADRKDIIHLGCVGLGEFFPAFAAEVVRTHPEFLEQLQCHRMDFAFGMAASAVALKASLAPMIQDRFRQNAARGITSAKKQDVA